MTREGIAPTAALPLLHPEKRPGAKPLFTLESLGDIPLQIEAPLGTVQTNLGEILSLAAGSIVMLDRLTGESVPVTANGTPIAKGEVRVHGERFAVRITEILGRGAHVRAGGNEPHARSASSP
jgi:flagellar motor switch protein FliN/FliY